MKQLTDAERQAVLRELPGWRAVEGRDALTRTLKFNDFREAFGFMTQVALVAGLKVTMVDLSEDAVAKAHGRIDAGLKKLVEKVFK